MRTVVLASLLMAGAAGIAHANDDISVRQVGAALDELEKAVNEGNLDGMSMKAWSIHTRLDDNKGEPDFTSDARFGKLVARWKALGPKIAAAAGGHSKEIYGDGKIPAGEDKDREELARDVLNACETTASTDSHMDERDIKTFHDNYAKYEKALARALKADDTSLRNNAGHWRLMECEFKVQQRQMDLEDTAVRDDSKTEKYKTCGYDEYQFQRLKIGSKWGSWELAGIPGSNGYPLDCKKHPKKNAISGNMAALIKQEFKYPGKTVWAVTGQPTTGQEGLKIYQYQSIRVYSPEIQVATTDCGSKDPKVVCEASGSKTVRAYNALTHLISRAEFHRDAGRVERCKYLYKQANNDAKAWNDFYDSANKSGDWAKGLTYKTRQDGNLTEAKIVAKVKEMAEQADERSLGKYCKK